MFINAIKAAVMGKYEEITKTACWKNNRMEGSGARKRGELGLEDEYVREPVSLCKGTAARGSLRFESS